HRIISRLAGAMLISPQQAQELRRKIDQLGGPATALVNPIGPVAEAEIVLESRPTPTTEHVHADDTAVPAAIASPMPPRQQTLDEFLAPRPVTSAMAPVTASTEEPPSTPPTGLAQPALAVEPSARPPVTSARASAGKSLAEFLAEHNIRWGELIAGLLIVVCSIGLVVSLWTTLTQMHRVIPSLIFLGGNAAIFGAGFYTLFRWRLQDSSRATLVIATLLVPLGILAGLSTGGTDTTAVALDDPITVLSILAAGAVYVTLIWQASRALVGSSDALPMTIGVAGPAAVLPFVLASIRTWQTSAGFVAYAGSIAVVAALWWMFSRRRELKGAATGRRVMTLGIISFSLATLAGYLAFMLRTTESSWLAIAAATLPGVVMLAASFGSLSSHSKQPKLALAGTVLSWFGLLAAGVLIVPMMVSMGWLWIWAVSFSAAAAVAAFVINRHRWTVVATLPIGLAVVLSSPAIASDVIWSELPVWKRDLGGEPMFAAIAVGLVGLVLSAAMRAADHRKAMLLSSGGWLSFATVNAAILTVAPESLMGIVPAWVLSVILGSTAVAA
ncbi:MAG: hypothetical protein KDA71_08445, partial [Planctomycetales bacterium]|nr:hypothetical protein [Planctomycetales bacterium]